MSRILRLLATFAVLGAATLLAACGNSTVTTTDANGNTTTRSVPYGTPITINVGPAHVAAPSVTLDGTVITGRTETLKVYDGDKSTVRVAAPGHAETLLKVEGVPAPERARAPQVHAAPPPTLYSPPAETYCWKYGDWQPDGYGGWVRVPRLRRCT